MEYSKFKRIKLKNWCSYDNIEIDFNESPIICLKGKNGVGKTNLIDAFSVIGRDKPVAGKLNELVQDGKTSFELECELEDGTLIERKKGKKNICKVTDKEGNVVLDVEKIDKGKEITEVIERVGFWVENESKQCLQMRSYHDALLFAETKASDNYRVFYNALKVDDIFNAIKFGNEDCNSIKGRIRDGLAKKKGLLEIKEQIKVVDTERLKYLKEKVERFNEYEELIDTLEEDIETSKKLKAEIKIPPKVSSVYLFLKDMISMYHMNNIVEKTKYVFLNELEEINELFNERDKIVEEIHDIKEQYKDMKLICVCPNCNKEIKIEF